MRSNDPVRGILAAVALALVASAAFGPGAGAQEIGPVRLAVNPWTGSAANVAVVAHLLENELGYEVELINIDENTAWQGFETGEVDAILEIWGHDADRALYIDEKGVAQDAGPMGVNGVIGWYVPGWMAEEYPGITDWENLNEHAELFRTSESGDKGQFLLGDPSYVSNDAALIENLGLEFTLVTGGSEAALIESFAQATNQRTPLLAYFYEPQWAWSQPPLLEQPLVKVNLPPWTEGCDAVPEEVACDYPSYELWKAVSTTFAENGGAAYELIRNFDWTNVDQATVSAYIDNEGMSAEDAAARWVEENPGKVAAWLPAA
jgi:glycine betaine/proline transport system substrate-binding protein